MVDEQACTMLEEHMLSQVLIARQFHAIPFRQQRMLYHDAESESC